MQIRLTAKQKEYIREANKRWNIKSGAVRSGKSYVDVSFIVPYRIRERIGKPGLAVILGVSRDTIERNVLQPMREIYTEELVGQINSKNMARLFGEDVYCLGAEKISQVAKIQGASIKYVYGDEIAKWNREVFEMLKSRLDKPYSCFDGACNPENPTHWLKKFIDSDADIYLQKYRIFDNPYLPREFVENLCREYEGTIYYDRLIEGLWKRAEGAIYRKFADNPSSYIRDVDVNEIERITIGIDFGGNGSGHSFVATSRLYNGDYHVLCSRRYMNKDYKQGIDPTKLEEIFVKFTEYVIDKYGYPDCVYWDNAETVLGQGIKNTAGRHFPSLSVKPALKRRIKDRIDYVLRLMGVKRIWLTKDCETLKIALSEAVWDKTEDEDVRLDDGSSDIDTLDSFEYTIERDIKEVRLNGYGGL